MSTIATTPDALSIVNTLAKSANERLAIKPDGELVAVGNSGRETPKKLGALRDKLSHDDWLSFVDSYVAVLPLPIQFASGQDIHPVFEKCRPGSCMRYGNLSELREVYADNPDIVQVAYWHKSDHPLLESDGSCLVWTDSKLSKSYIDRFYSNGWSDCSMVRRVCQRLAQLLPESEVVTIYTNIKDFPYYDGKLSFTLDHPSDRLLPYADTLSVCIDYDDSTVKLSNRGSGTSLSNVNGVLPDGEGGGLTCDNCNCTCDEEECYYTDGGDTLCDECGGHCEWCESAVLNDDLQYVEVYQTQRRYLCETASICSCCLSDDFTETDSGWCHDNDLIETVEGDQISPTDYENGDYVTLDIGDNAGEVCKVDNAIMVGDEWAYRDDCQELHDGEFALSEDCQELHNGEFALSEDCQELHNGEFALSEDCQELHNGEYALSEDCQELHNGEYALTEDCQELHDGSFGLLMSTIDATRYPNFVNYNPEIGYLQKCNMRMVGDDTEREYELLKGLPFAVGEYLGSWRVYHLPTGLVAKVADDRNDAIAKAKRIWNMLYEQERIDVLNTDETAYRNSPLGQRFRYVIQSAV